ncbi:MAG: hypothetical protein JWN71_1901 [Xanthobacteraceae bacterium]|jgi:hypothetical protein|nr:hypothetical protein [Xanthobacteraceae bacterium]
MFRVIAILILAIGLASCDAVNTVKEGFSHARAVEADLEQSIGLKPAVGFNWNNGRLLSVTVIFPRIYDAKPPRELGEMVRAAVTKQFKQAPESITFGFTVEKPATGA